MKSANSGKEVMHKWTIGVSAFCTLLAFGAPAQAQQEHSMDSMDMSGDPLLTKLMLDRLEWRDADPEDLTYWEAQVWIGHDINKLWLKSEGSYADGETEDADLEAYYSRAVAAYWDMQIGARHDFAVGGQPSRNWMGVGFKGLAPYKFDVDATLYAGGVGQIAARAKVEYDLLLTQRLVLMPELEANLYSRPDEERGLGSGLANLDAALRLRYEFRREFAPYVGGVWTRKYGDTADFARDAGAPDHDEQFVVGLRAWW